MSLQGLNGMPDLQLRMSRKVAQLTKVIVQLNEKNEDSDADFQDVAEQYEKEIALILRETAERVNTFKNKLEAARDDKHILQIQQDLEGKYEERIRKLQAELENLRKRSAEKEAAIQKAATKQIDGLSDQVQQLQVKLQQCLKELDDERRGDRTKDLEEQLHAARRELQAATQVAERKYSALLAEGRLREDGLQAKLDEVSRQYNNEASARQTAEHECSELRGEWEQRYVELQEQYRAMDTSWKSKVEAMVEQVQDAKAAAKQAVGNEQQATEHAKQLETALTQLRAERQCLEAKLQSLHESSTSAMTDLQQRLQAAEEQAASIASSFQEKRQQLEQAADTAQTENTRLAARLSATQAELDKTNKALAQRTSEHSSKQLESHEAVKQLTAKVNELEGCLQQAQQHGQAEAIKATADMHQRLLAVEAQHQQALAASQRDAASRAEVARAEAATKLAGAEMKLRKEMVELKQELEQSKASAIATLTQQHARQCETYNQESTSLKRQIAELMQLLADEKRKKEGLAGQLESQTKSANAGKGQLEDRVQALTALEMGLRSELAELTARLEKNQQASDATAQALKDEVRRLTAELDSLRSKLAKEQQDASARQQALLQEAATERMLLERGFSNKLTMQVKEAVAVAEQRHAAELSATCASLSAQQAQALAAAEAKSKAVQAQALAAWQAEAQAAAARLVIQLEECKAQLEECKALHAKELAAEQLRRSEQAAAHQTQLKQIRVELSLQHQVNEQSLKDCLLAEMEAALEQQRRVHAEQVEGLKAGMRAAHEEEMRGERASAEMRLAEMEAKCKVEVDRWLTKADGTGAAATNAA